MDLELYAYFNTSQYMQSLDDFRMGHAPNHVRPDAQALVDLKPSVPLPLNCNWVPLHICGTPITPTGHVPLIARSFATISTNPNQEAITCLAWIDVQNVINHLRNNDTEGDREVKVQLESLVKDHSYYNHGKDVQLGMEIGWTKYEVGTCGRHAFWIRQETVPIVNTDGSGEESAATITRPVVEIVSLPFDEEEIEKSVRRLQLPVDVTDDMAMLKFSDEWGMLAYMKSSEQEIQEIHIFDY
ncbi:hypothetical protein FS837_010183 [Tulasnella sp. UAMH 9824]|nr:hypothetical protein FS837_010183 [Tulasnella sp. UAMH 9824]